MQRLGGPAVKLIHSNGHLLEVRDVGGVVFRLRAGEIPIKVNGYHLLENDPARDLLRDLLATGWYTGGRVEPD